MIGCYYLSRPLMCSANKGMNINVTHFSSRCLPVLNSNCMQIFYLSLPRFAAKKKGVSSSSSSSEGSSERQTPKQDTNANNIFNIYQNIQDHQILADNFYPPWLWKLANKQKGYGQLAMMFLYGRGIEESTAFDFLRFCRLHRKTKIQLNNARLKKSKRNSIKPLFWDV